MKEQRIESLLKNNFSTGKDACNIRVISFTTTDRALIKGIEGMAQDIAFAFILAPVLLACIDAVGDVYVYTVEENQLNALTCCLMVHIKEVGIQITTGMVDI